MNRLALRLPASDLMRYVKNYNYPASDEPIVSIGLAARARGWIEKEELARIERWKNPRFAGKVGANDEEFVRQVTTTALCTPSERLRIESLTLLDGVGWPMASVVLHFCHADRYPLLDARALWTLGVDKLPNQYDFRYWESYVSCCRLLADELKTDMRALDRALWGYSNAQGQMAHV